jgi:myo-inositol-1(or 4)-monophosphatase
MHPMLNVAVKAARAAGAIINRASLDIDAVRVSRKAVNDFVTEVDQEAEQIIIQTLLEAYPTHGILAEESGRAHGNSKSDYQWIIDPLDGTTNFIHGLPIYCVSIALLHKGVPQHAVVYDPTRNDLFNASKGAGAFLNNKRVRVSKRTTMQDSLIGTGFPFRAGDDFDRYMRMFTEVMKSTAGMRRPGAAALDLAYVAAGYYDGFYEVGLNPWDVAAGSLLVLEAGGLVGNFRGEADYLFQREVVAGTPKVFGQLLKILTPFSEALPLESMARKPVTPAVRPAAPAPKLQESAQDGSPARKRLQVRKISPAVEEPKPKTKVQHKPRTTGSGSRGGGGSYGKSGASPRPKRTPPSR